MRVDAYSKINQIYQTTKKTAVSRTSKSHGSDKVEISQFGRDYQIAKQAVAEAPDIRADKVAEMKSKIESGEYSVSADELAEKLAAKYNTTIF